MCWIDYRDEPIPEELKYPGWQTDRDKDGQNTLDVMG